MTPSKPSPNLAFGEVSTSYAPSQPPGSSSVEPRSSRFTVLGFELVVARDGKMYRLILDDYVESILSADSDFYIGVESVKVAERLDMEDMARSQ